MLMPRLISFFRAPAVVAAICILLVLVTGLFAYETNKLPRFTHAASSPLFNTNKNPTTNDATHTGITSTVDDSQHPIDQLVRVADQHFETLTKDEAHKLAEAAKQYRSRRGRHPPPGFDAWFKLAKREKSVIPESFFDQIYHDLEPFWGANPRNLRAFANKWPHVISIRDHAPLLRSPIPKNYWLTSWQEMIRKMPFLPDVDLPMSYKDEPCITMTFQRVTEYMKRAEQSRLDHNSLPNDRIRNIFQKYPKMQGSIPEAEPPQDHTLISPRKYWDFVVDACRPDDPIFTEPQSLLNSSNIPIFSEEHTAGTLQGYVSNFTIAKNVCHNPNLRSLHGHLIAPHLSSVYTDLYPIFGVAKLVGVNNDIVIPTPEHWVDFGSYTGIEKDSQRWKEKTNKAVWRGTASGGEHNATNWKGFHRHRLIAMMNSTTVSYVEKEMRPFAEPSYSLLKGANSSTFDWGIHNIPYPSPHLFNITAQVYHKLGEWTAKIGDGGFTQSYCYPFRLMAEAFWCPYTEPYFSEVPKLSKNEIMNHKYLPDIDGQSSSGRFRGFLQSLSVPIKATVFTEWFDDRLVPWRHYVPMSNEFQEWWGLMEYFIGFKGEANELTVDGHDAVGEKIGRVGSEWAHRVLRKEDMVLYFYRVILEYARICADNRIELGFTDDL